MTCTNVGSCLLVVIFFLLPLITHFCGEHWSYECPLPSHSYSFKEEPEGTAVCYEGEIIPHNPMGNRGQRQDRLRCELRL